MRVKISKNGYATKPSAEEIKKITWYFKNNNCVEVSFEELLNFISKGHSVLLADFKDNCGNINVENIQSLSCLSLDIDSKENKITMDKMIDAINKKLNITPILAYRTFSDTDNSKFRLIYKLEDKVDTEVYKKLYKAIQWKFNKYLDPVTFNPNRIWAGTNKGVLYNPNNKPITFQLMIKLINAYESKLKREEEKKKATKKQMIYNDNFYNDEFTSYIKPKYKEEVLEYLIQNIDLKDFIQKHFGGNFKKENGNWVGACSIHGGDNKHALVISDRIYTCFTRCGTGNIITVARIVYKDTNFSNVALRLASEHGLNIPKEYLKENLRDGAINNHR